ncbi:hypothetical protein SAMN05421805_1189 [Saccharopolyspora antimicrobica]|uniref:Uncharacterized protein n=1 Tax=Saccharopolyspora antimicrobica TaxID=455193 RepID=A0A1I5I9F4_9PSEU|nr:hypothetical protein [Saccharopolyspora antimicrobica]RKT85590.1 hypothetical protein ATL45_3937 [Saccharopolyspora antimicrobica]SFO57192.1 hypothetical protein SAMN05421805_1189 [Saccharopolyspora antimicrobica]
MTMQREAIEAGLSEAEAAYGDTSDPYRQAQGYDSAAILYAELAAHTDDPTWKNAAVQAGQRYAVLAAQVRHRHGIPTPFPEREAALLRGAGAPAEVTIRVGPTPRDKVEAEQLAAAGEVSTVVVQADDAVTGGSRS